MDIYDDESYEGYDEDYAYFETDDYYDYGGELKEWSTFQSLYKAPNGHLVFIEARGYCLWGQDWGETVGQWTTDYINLAQLDEWHKLWAIYLGRTMQTDETIDYYYPDIEEEIDEKESEISAYVANLRKAEAELKALQAILKAESE